MLEFCISLDFQLICQAKCLASQRLSFGTSASKVILFPVLRYSAFSTHTVYGITNIPQVKLLFSKYLSDVISSVPHDVNCVSCCRCVHINRMYGLFCRE